MKEKSQLYSLLKEFQKVQAKRFSEKYQQDYNKLMINNIMWNAKEHLVCLFKDYLIYDELSEFFIIFFPSNKAIKKLKELINYYNESSFIFPNYTPLPESKYIYKNIIKKQRVIDEQENLEELKKKQIKLKEKKKNIFYEFYNNSESQSKFFNSSIYNSILKPSESLLKILFGIDNENNTKNASYYFNKNFISNNTDNGNINDNEEVNIEEYYSKENIEEIISNDCEDDNQLDEIKSIIKVIDKYEKKKSALVSIKDFIKNNNNKNKNSKIKIKLGLLPKNNENYNNNSIINRTDMGKIGKNILNNYYSNNFFKKRVYNGKNNSGINPMKNSGIQIFRNDNKKNSINIFNFRNKTKPEININESITNPDLKKPLMITDYNYKNNNVNTRSANNDKGQKHKKVKSTFCFNELNYYNDYLNKLNLNGKNDIYKKYYKNDFNTPTAKRTKTLNKNINNYKLCKKDKSIININININETNLYLNNNPNKNKNHSMKNKNYPTIIPKLDFNLINNNKSIKNKNIEKTLNLNDLKSIYNNNFTERNLNSKNTRGKNQYKINEKLKLMLGLSGINNKINKIGFNNDEKKSKKLFTENNKTLKLNVNKNIFKKVSNSNNKSNKKKDKNELAESANKIKMYDFYSDRNSYKPIK